MKPLAWEIQDEGQNVAQIRSRSLSGHAYFDFAGLLDKPSPTIRWFASTEAKCQWNCSAHRLGRVSDFCPTMKGVATSMCNSRLSPQFRVSAKGKVTKEFSCPDVHRIHLSSNFQLSNSPQQFFALWKG